MLITAVVLFLLAAVFGLYVLTAILRDQPTPKPIVLFHGMAAATALLVVIVYAVTSPSVSYLLITSIVLFVLAALGGLTLVTIDLTNRPIPKMLALLHPLVAVSGLVVLLIYMFG